MKRLLVLTLVPIGAAVVIGATVAPSLRSVGTSVPKANAETKKAKDPVDVVIAQLHRRFTDTRDVDFGFTRISRPKARIHSGPVMDRNDLRWIDFDSSADGGFDKRLVRKSGDGYELRAEDSSWISWDDVREQMRPENDAEKTAIGSLLSAKREIAIYTFGNFRDGAANRARGPAYLRQKGPEAPKADNLKAVAEEAWQGGAPELPGFRLRAERVFAKASCVSCHNEMRGVDEQGKAHPGGYKTGDALGLILIAEKK